MLFNSHKQETVSTWTYSRLFTHIHILVNHGTNCIYIFVSFRLFGTKCDKCGNSFSKNDFVMRAKTKIFHIECFRCSACARQLLPGKSIFPPLFKPQLFIYINIDLFINPFRRWIRVTWCGSPVLQRGSRCAGEIIAK